MRKDEPSSEVGIQGSTDELLKAADARAAYAGRLLPDRQLEMFRSSDWGFATRVVRRGQQVRPLPRASRQIDDIAILSNGQRYDLADYISRNRIAGLLILKDGRIELEHYELGNDADTRWISMSMAKSVSTTLVGAAIRDGLIGSVEDPLVKYLPQLKDGGYDAVSIRHLLQMSSGVLWDDTHTDPLSERSRMLDLQIEQKAGAILEYVSGQPKIAASGTVWNYSTGETHVVGSLLQAVTGRWVADYLSEKIWAPFGMEADATWWLETPDGLEVAGSGINATLRDYGRFGLFALADGHIDGVSVLPRGWMAEASSARDIGGKQVNYGYMWWPVAGIDGRYDDRAYSARGIFGQYIYINPATDLVVVVLSARSKPKGAEAIPDNDFFNSVAAQIRDR